MKEKAKHLLSRRMLITAVLILIQLGWIALMVLRLAEYSVAINITFLAISLLIVLFLVNKDENPAYKIGWFILIGLLPLFGGLMYVFFGNKRPTHRNRKLLADVQKKTAPLLQQDEATLEALGRENSRWTGTATYLARQGPFPVWQDTDVRYYPVGEDLYADLLQDLEGAQHFIFLEYFIIAQGVMWEGILDILRAYHECGFEGYIRPDHGRHLWDEGPGNVRPGYGLYDRALGIMYMLGAWDLLDKQAGK